MSNAHCHYQIILRPLENYFFGGENYFNEEDRVFYFQKSREFPQQTSLLGLVRHQLLLQNNLLVSGKITDVKEAEELIGPKSFDANIDQTFGKIASLSPVFIVDAVGTKWIPYWKAKQDKDNEKTLEHAQMHHISGKLALSLESTQESIPHLANYSPKSDFEYGFQDESGSDYLSYEAIFGKAEHRVPQIGIYKNYREPGASITEDDGFFKFQYGRLNKEYKFSFYLQLTEEKSLNSTTVLFGKERRAFQMEVKKLDNKNWSNEKIQGGDTLHLLSDAKLPLSFRDHCASVVSKTLSFRNLNYSIKNTEINYSGDIKDFRSAKIYLVEKGSMLYVKNDQACADALYKMFNSEQGFLKIGYNHYRILK